MKKPKVEVEHKPTRWEKFLINNRFLGWLVSLMLKYRVFLNHGKFKAGDLVTYNWRAYVFIYSAIHGRTFPVNVVSVRHKDKNYIEMTDIAYGGTTFADAFWLRHAKHTDFPKLTKL